MKYSLLRNADATQSRRIFLSLNTLYIQAGFLNCYVNCCFLNVLQLQLRAARLGNEEIPPIISLSGVTCVYIEKVIKVNELK